MAFVNLAPSFSSSIMQSSLPTFSHSNRFLLLNKKIKAPGLDSRFRCLPALKQENPPFSRREDDVEMEPVELDQLVRKILRSETIKQHVESIGAILTSMGDGEVSISPYDTAWVALVEDINGNNSPQFPAALDWIVKNQLQDGSWGDSRAFLSYDRVICTLACVVALKSWDVHHEKITKGITFVQQNLGKLGDDNPQHMTIGFEVIFPPLVELAKSLGINLQDDALVLQNIYHHRDIKFKRIPWKIMHTRATTLLFTLEAMPGLDWDKLLKLKGQNGSFLTSPASTAFALMQTKDHTCFKYLDEVVRRFDGGAPNVYPVDMFERIWAVDRLQRLGISRHFRTEIEECLNYVQRNWTERGIAWASNIDVQEIDATANGFRLLRLHGRGVSSDVFKHFEKDGEFFCLRGQSTESITVMHSLYRASQLQYPGVDSILEKARRFSFRFLKGRRDSEDFIDKWVIAKDIAGEVTYALDVPWYANLPRVEARFYIDQYGGDEDVWIGKALYRMPNVNNNLYLKLAKLDFNNCQALHRLEWESVKKWCEDLNLEKYGAGKRGVLVAYFVAAANIFEPERSKERLAWAKTLALVETVASYFDSKPSCGGEMTQFLSGFRFHFSASVDHPHISTERQVMKGREPWQALLESLLATISELSSESQATNHSDVFHHLCRAWEKWLVEWQEKGNRYSAEAELVVSTIDLCSGRRLAPTNHNDMLLPLQHLFRASNNICQKLNLHTPEMINGAMMRSADDTFPSGFNASMTAEMELGMQTLLKLVLGDPSDGINRQTKQTFLDVIKGYYYVNYFPPGMIHFHIAKALYERVS